MRQVTTYQMRLPRGPHEDVLDAAARRFGEVERDLHADLRRAHREAAGDPERLRELKNALKARTLIRQGITGRQYNAVLTGLEGRYDSVRENLKAEAETLTGRLAKTRKRITADEKALGSFRKVSREVDERAKRGKGPTKAQAKRMLSRDRAERAAQAVHEGKRRADRITHQLDEIRQELARPVPAVVFGGRELLRERAGIHPNDAQALAAWRARWDASRSGGFLCLGHKGEAGCCQSCVAAFDADGLMSLRVRLPVKGGEGRHLTLTGLGFPEHGRAEIRAALLRRDGPISYRFVRDEGWPAKAGLSAWRVCVTLSVPTPEIKPAFEASRQEGLRPLPGFAGALGVDINADRLAYAVIDRCGNPLTAGCGQVALPLRGKSSGQRRALIEAAAIRISLTAKRLGLPVVMERLDFSAKKRTMGEKGPGYARMLSSLPYAQVQRALRRRGSRDGVELVSVPPAYTSLIGRVNLAARYGLSVHVSAAAAIARRAARFSERVNYHHGPRGRRNAVPTRSESRAHVWRQWARVLRDLDPPRGRHRRPAAGAPDSARSSSQGRDARGGPRPEPGACPP